jgi:hypothetical protein
MPAQAMLEMVDNKVQGADGGNATTRFASSIRP